METNCKSHYLASRLKSGTHIEFSVFNVLPNVLMLRGENVCVQWSLNRVGVEISDYDKMIKIGFHYIHDELGDCQYFFFDKGEKSALFNFFKSLGLVRIEENQVD